MSGDPSAVGGDLRTTMMIMLTLNMKMLNNKLQVSIKKLCRETQGGTRETDFFKYKSLYIILVQYFLNISSVFSLVWQIIVFKFPLK